MAAKDGPLGGGWSGWLQDQARRAETPVLRAFYERFPADAGQPVGQTPLVALDLETSGLDPRRHAILSIGLVPFDLNAISIAQRRYWILRPPRGFSGESVAYHHITHADTEQAPDFAEILPDLLDALAGRLPVVHYHPIERGFLERAVHQRGLGTFRFPVIDTMAIEARRYRQRWRMGLRRLLGKAPTSIRLNDSRARYHLPAYEGHQAVIDATGTAELLQAQIQHHYRSSTAVGDLWV